MGRGRVTVMSALWKEPVWAKSTRDDRNPSFVNLAIAGVLVYALFAWVIAPAGARVAYNHRFAPLVPKTVSAVKLGAGVNKAELQIILEGLTTSTTFVADLKKAGLTDEEVASLQKDAEYRIQMLKK